jgi:hypothetical protein
VATATSTPIPPAPLVSPGDDDTDTPRKQTAEHRQQREDTNAGNRDDVYTEGNVVEVHLDATQPYVVIGNRDGLMTLYLLCGGHCPTIRVGDYITADGAKESEQVFYADEIDVTSGR